MALGPLITVVIEGGGAVEVLSILVWSLPVLCDMSVNESADCISDDGGDVVAPVLDSNAVPMPAREFEDADDGDVPEADNAPDDIGWELRLDDKSASVFPVVTVLIVFPADMLQDAVSLLPLPVTVLRPELPMEPPISDDAC